MSKKKRNFLIFIIIAIAILVCLALLLYRLLSPQNTQVISQVIENRYEQISPVKTISLKPLEDQIGQQITCTGLTYDSENHFYWIGNYGKSKPNVEEKSPQIIECNEDFTSCKNIIALEESVNVQGIAYDHTSQTLWYTDGNTVNQIDRQGTLISSFNLGKYSKFEANGIAIDEDDCLWILCYYEYLLKFNKNGKLLEVIDSNYIAQDHLCFYNSRLYFSVGDDYQGKNNYVIEYSPDKTSFEKVYQVNESYAIEGIVIVDNHLLVANDGYYHDAINLDNYICEYDLN